MSEYIYEICTTRGKISGSVETVSLKQMYYYNKLIHMCKIGLENWKECIIINKKVE